MPEPSALALSLLPVFLGRALATALLIVVVARVAERAGPFLASVVLTLPLFAGPSFFFLMSEQPASFIAEGALFAFAGTGAVLAFTVGFIHAARRFGLLASLACAAAGWTLLAVPMRLLPLDLPVAACWCLVGVVIARATARRFDLHGRPGTPSPRWRTLAWRAAVSGLAVATVTVFAGSLGPRTTGLVVSFPLTISVSTWMLYRQYGAEFAAATLSATQRTLLSYASFCLGLGLLAERLPVTVAFWTALAVSATCAVALAITGHRARARP